MSSTELMNRPAEAEKIERVLIGGDLGKLGPEERVSYYRMVCESVGLNPLTKPFEYITLNGKLTLYARKDCTDQLRKVHSVSLTIAAREVAEGCYVVTARATLPNGRQDESIGAVPIENLKGEARANALMKCETKAKRRVTLSICGLGMLDETEIETIPSAKPPVQRTTEAIPINRPHTAGVAPQDVPISAPANKRQDGQTQEGTLVAQGADTHSMEPVCTKNSQCVVHYGECKEGLPSPAKAAGSPLETNSFGMPIPPSETLTAALIQKAEEIGVIGADCIDAGMAANLHRLFRDTLPVKLRKQSEEMLHDYLRTQKIVDVLGKPSALAIKKENFYTVREQAVQFAGTFKL